ncbi:MAG TPA: extracellular solute-binding protein [Propionibacteriaceae bacterium]
MAIPRRRFLSMTGGVAATALGLSACGGNTGRPDPASSASGSAGPKPELSSWFHQYGEEGTTQALERYAAAYEPATVKVKVNPSDYDKIVSAALLTDQRPDVFEYANGATLDMIKAGQVVDLTDTLGDAAAQFSKPVLDAVSWQDKIYAIPQIVDMQMLYYRKSVLDKAGIAPPTTMDELIAAAKAVTTKDRGGFFAGNDSGVGVLTQLLIWSAGQELINADGTGIGFDNDAGYQALAQFAALKNSGGLLESASADWFASAPFTNEETVMQWGGLWVLPEVQQALGDDFGVVPFPAIGAAGRQAVPFGAFSSVVAAQGVDPDAAKAYVKWLWVDQEADQVDFANAYGTHIPAKPALFAQADKIATGAGADAAKFVNELGHAPDKLWTTAISNAAVAAVTNVITKKADPKSEIAKVAAKAKSEIQRVNG